ncbi:MAG: hypothetical protein ACM3QS_05605 [Bacteroidota bacterium]
MLQIFSALSIWLHALATAILIGHFLLLALIYLPALATRDGSILAEISKRSRNWLYLSLVVFFLTGTYLTLVDPNYLGLANFNNPWTILMLVKHLLVVGMLAAGFWFNAILRVGPMLNSGHGAARPMGAFRLYVNLMAIAGALILLLTALGQVQ